MLVHLPRGCAGYYLWQTSSVLGTWAGIQLVVHLAGLAGCGVVGITSTGCTEYEMSSGVDPTFEWEVQSLL